MNNKEKFNELLELFLRIQNKFNHSEKKPKCFCHDSNEKLYTSEVHMIQAIAKYPEANITELSIRLGITKGAVSQLISKLKKKKLVFKCRKEDNYKEVLIKLTDEGRHVYLNHEEYHKKRFEELVEYFNDFSNEQIELIENVFKKIESFIDKINDDHQ